MAQQPIFRPYTGGIQPVQGQTEAGANIGQMIQQGLSSFGTGIGRGIEKYNENIAAELKEYQRMKEIDEGANAGLSEVENRMIPYLTDAEMQGQVSHIGDMLKKARNGNTQAKLAAIKSAELQLGQLPSPYQLRKEDQDLDATIRQGGAAVAGLLETMGQNPANRDFVNRQQELIKGLAAYNNNNNGQTWDRRHKRTLAAMVTGTMSNLNTQYSLHKENQAAGEQRAALEGKANVGVKTQVSVAANLPNVVIDTGKSLKQNVSEVVEVARRAHQAGHLKDFNENAVADAVLSQTEKAIIESGADPITRAAFAAQAASINADRQLARIRGVFLKPAEALSGSTKQRQDEVRKASSAIFQLLSGPVGGRMGLGTVTAGTTAAGIAASKVAGGISSGISRMQGTSIKDTMQLVYQRHAADAFSKLSPSEQEELQGYASSLEKLRAITAGATASLEGIGNVSGIGGFADNMDEWRREQGLPLQAEFDAANSEYMEAFKAGNEEGMRVANEKRNAISLKWSEAGSVPMRYQIEPHKVMDIGEYLKLSSAYRAKGMDDKQIQATILAENKRRVEVLIASRLNASLAASLGGVQGAQSVEEVLKIAMESAKDNPDVLKNIAEGWLGPAAGAGVMAYFAANGGKKTAAWLGTQLRAAAASGQILTAGTPTVTPRTGAAPRPAPAPATPPQLTTPIPQGGPSYSPLPAKPPAQGPSYNVPPSIQQTLGQPPPPRSPTGSPVPPTKPSAGAAPRPQPAPQPTPQATPAAQAAPAAPQAPAAPAAQAAAQAPKAGFLSKAWGVVKGAGRLGGATIMGHDLGENIPEALLAGFTDLSDEEIKKITGYTGVAGAVGGLAVTGAAMAGSTMAAGAAGALWPLWAIWETGVAGTAAASRYIAAPIYGGLQGMSAEEWHAKEGLGSLSRFSVIGSWFDSLSGTPISSLEAGIQRDRMAGASTMREGLEKQIEIGEARRRSLQEKAGLLPQPKEFAGVAIGDVVVGTRKAEVEKPREQLKQEFFTFLQRRLGYLPTTAEEMFTRQYETDKPIVIRGQDGRDYQKKVGKDGSVSFDVLPQIDRTAEEKAFLAKQEAAKSNYDTYLTSDDSDPNAYRMNLKGQHTGGVNAITAFNQEVVDTVAVNGGIRRLIEFARNPANKANPNAKMLAENLALSLRGRVRTAIAGGGAPSNYEQIEILKKYIENPTDIFTWPQNQIDKLEDILRQSEQTLINKGRLSGVTITIGNPQSAIQNAIEQQRERDRKGY